jgi:hypothetical protein
MIIWKSGTGRMRSGAIQQSQDVRGAPEIGFELLRHQCHEFLVSFTMTIRSKRSQTRVFSAS